MSSASLTVSLPAGRTHTVTLTATSCSRLARMMARYIRQHARRMGVAPIALDYRYLVSR